MKTYKHKAFKNQYLILLEYGYLILLFSDKEINQKFSIYVDEAKKIIKKDYKKISKKEYFSILKEIHNSDIGIKNQDFSYDVTGEYMIFTKNIKNENI